MTCRYRFILMRANTRRKTSVVSLMELMTPLRSYFCSTICHQGTDPVTIPITKRKKRQFLLISFNN